MTLLIYGVALLVAVLAGLFGFGLYRALRSEMAEDWTGEYRGAHRW